MQQQQTPIQVIGHTAENLKRLSDEMVLQVIRKNIPIFVGERNSKGGLSFKCPHCTRSHHHKKGSGMRKPHCFKKPPVYLDGYYLLEPMNALGFDPTAKIKRTQLLSFLERLNGKVFSIDFVKLNNEHRSITGKLGVKNPKKGPLKGCANKAEALDRPYLTVYDIHLEDYRNINLDTTTRVRVNGNVYDVID